MTVTLELLFPHLDELIQTPADLQRLNEAILQLAVQGKLVPQDPQDEPAGELLKRITVEKERLVAEGEVKKEKSLPPIDEDEVSFGVPVNWQWIRFGVLAQIQSGYAFKSEWYSSTGIRLVRNVNIGHGSIDWSDTANLPVDKREEFANFELKENDLLISLDRPIISTGLKLVQVTHNDLPSLLVQRVGRMLFFCDDWIDLDYVKIWFKSSVFLDSIDPGRSNGVPHISQKDVANAPFPLPPLAEQKRIVAKVDELLTRCAALERKLRRAQEAIVVVNRAVLHHLHHAADPATFQHTAQILGDHFDLLYTDPLPVTDLRQTILQLAVQGKLVPQDPHDEPAGALLKRVEKEKERLVAEGKLRPEKLLPTVDESDAPFEIPTTWIWARVQHIAITVTDGEHATPPRSDSGPIPLATAKNIRDGFIDLEVTDYVDMNIAQKSWQRCKPEHKDILMVCVGATTGRLCLVNEPPPMVLVRSVALLRPCTAGVHPEYLEVTLRSPALQEQIWASVKRTAQPCLYINRMQNLLVPLPPLAEQKRIVAKVDALLARCAALESKLDKAQAAGRQLTVAVLHGAVG